MNDAGGYGGKGAIAKIGEIYRIFHATETDISYSDDFGDTWSKSTGLVGTEQFGILVYFEDSNIVYAYNAKYNPFWHSDTTKTEPTLDDAQYDLGVSIDGGKTFTNNIVSPYDQCDVSNRIAYLEKGKIVLAAGWNGAFIYTISRNTITKLNNVFYCKTIGYGAPEKEGRVNTLFMYGKPNNSDIVGIYRSTNSGKTWVLINTQNLFGGTGNGNFLVGDLNNYGMVYMSTAGNGIIYGKPKI